MKSLVLRQTSYCSTKSPVKGGALAVVNAPPFQNC